MYPQKNNRLPEKTWIGKVSHELNAMDQIIWNGLVSWIVNWLYSCTSTSDKINYFKKVLLDLASKKKNNTHYSTLYGMILTYHTILTHKLKIQAEITRRDLTRNHQGPYVSRKPLSRSEKRKRKKVNMKTYETIADEIDKLLSIKFSWFLNEWFNRRKVDLRYFSTIKNKLERFNKVSREWFKTNWSIDNNDIVISNLWAWRLVINMTTKKIYYFKTHNEYDQYLDWLR